MTKKKVLSLVVTLAMLVGLLPGFALAEGETNWADQVAEMENLTPNEGVYELGTAEDLARFAYEINNSVEGGATSASNAVLTADIDLSAHLWTPISTYSGTFDGQGHTISGMTVSETVSMTGSSSNRPIIGFYAQLVGGTMCNVSFVSASVTCANNKLCYDCGIVAGRLNAAVVRNVGIYDCTIVLNVTDAAFAQFVGLCGNGTDTTVIDNCCAVGSLVSTAGTTNGFGLTSSYNAPYELRNSYCVAVPYALGGDYMNMGVSSGSATNTSLFSTSNCFYDAVLASSGVTACPGVTGLTTAEMQSWSAAYKLNGNKFGTGVTWTTDDAENPTNGGYPVFGDTLEGFSLTLPSGLTATASANETVTGDVYDETYGYAAGATITLAVKDGYELSGAPTVAGVTVTDNEDGTYSFTMPENDATVSATLTALALTWTVEASTPEGGYKAGDDIAMDVYVQGSTADMSIDSIDMTIAIPTGLTLKSIAPVSGLGAENNGAYAWSVNSATPLSVDSKTKVATVTYTVDTSGNISGELTIGLSTVVGHRDAQTDLANSDDSVLTTTVTVTVSTYTVTVGETTLENAAAGAAYTWTPSADAGKLVIGVSATAGGNAIDAAKITKNADGSYTIAADAVTGDIVLTYTTINGTLTVVEKSDYAGLASDSYRIVKLTGATAPEGKHFAINGAEMYSKSGVFYAIVESSTVTAVTALPMLTIVDGAASSAYTLSTDGNLNKVGAVTAADSSVVNALVYDVTTSYMTDWMRLSADMNNDGNVTTADIIWILEAAVGKTHGNGGE